MQLSSLGLAAELGMLTSLAGACGDLGRAGQRGLAPAKKENKDGKSHDKYSATIKRARLWGGRNQSLLL